MIDVDPEEFIAGRINTTRKSVWLRIPGKHRNEDEALEALENMIATRH